MAVNNSMSLTVFGKKKTVSKVMLIMIVQVYCDGSPAVTQSMLNMETGLILNSMPAGSNNNDD